MNAVDYATDIAIKEARRQINIMLESTSEGDGTVQKAKHLLRKSRIEDIAAAIEDWTPDDLAVVIRALAKG